MSVVENMLRALVGEEAATKIIEHPNLHVLSLPAETVLQLVTETLMVVPVGILCELCDLPAANKFCQCETETITDDEGFTITSKHRKGDDATHTHVVKPLAYTGRASIPPGQLGGEGGAPFPPAYQHHDDRLLLRPADDGHRCPEQPGAVQGGDSAQRGDVQDRDVPSVQGWGVDSGTESSASVGETSSGGGDGGCGGGE